jgi:hypothetical protein
MFGIKIMSENQLLNGYANGITPNGWQIGGRFNAANVLLCAVFTHEFNLVI